MKRIQFKLMNQDLGGSNGNNNPNTQDNALSKINLDGDSNINVDTSLENEDNIDTNINKTDTTVDNKDTTTETTDNVETTETKDIDNNTEITSTIIGEVITRTGISIIDDNNNPITYEDTEEGIAKYVQDAIEVKGIELAQDYIKEEFEKYPELARVHQYLLTHNGSLEGFNDRRDYKSLSVTSEQSQFDIIVEFEKKLGGKDEDTARFLAESIKKSGKLETYSKQYLDKLVEHQTTIEKQELDNLNNQRRIEQENQDRFYRDLADKLINKGEMFDFNLPLEIKVNKDNKQVVYKRDDIYKYITQPVTKEGYSQYQLDKHKLNTEKGVDILIYDAIMLLTKNDHSVIINKLVKDKEVKGLKERMAGNKTANYKDNGSSNKENPINKIK